jgi:hypothetical protein
MGLLFRMLPGNISLKIIADFDLIGPEKVLFQYH